MAVIAVCPGFSKIKRVCGEDNNGSEMSKNHSEYNLMCGNQQHWRINTMLKMKQWETFKVAPKCLREEIILRSLDRDNRTHKSGHWAHVDGSGHWYVTWRKRVHVRITLSTYEHLPRMTCVLPFFTSELLVFCGGKVLEVWGLARQSSSISSNVLAGRNGSSEMRFPVAFNGVAWFVLGFRGPVPDRQIWIAAS